MFKTSLIALSLITSFAAVSNEPVKAEQSEKAICLLASDFLRDSTLINKYSEIGCDIDGLSDYIHVTDIKSYIVNVSLTVLDETRNVYKSGVYANNYGDALVINLVLSESVRLNHIVNVGAL